MWLDCKQLMLHQKPNVSCVFRELLSIHVETKILVCAYHCPTREVEQGLFFNDTAYYTSSVPARLCKPASLCTYLIPFEKEIDVHLKSFIYFVSCCQ